MTAEAHGDVRFRRAIEESLDRSDWPETATELSFLEGKRAELESQRADLELVEALDVLEDYAVVDGIHTLYRR